MSIGVVDHLGEAIVRQVVHRLRQIAQPAADPLGPQQRLIHAGQRQGQHDQPTEPGDEQRPGAGAQPLHKRFSLELPYCAGRRDPGDAEARRPRS